MLILLATMSNCSAIGEVAVDYFGQNQPLDTPEVFAQDLISVKGRFEYGISFSPDAKEVAYGVLDMKDERGQIFYSRSIENKWAKPSIVGFLSNYSVFLPFFKPDNQSVLYTQKRQHTSNYITDIWIVNKLENGWGEPVRLPEPINSATREGSVCMILNNTLYFSSGRNCEGTVNCPANDDSAVSVPRVAL